MRYVEASGWDYDKRKYHRVVSKKCQPKPSTTPTNHSAKTIASFGGYRSSFLLCFRHIKKISKSFSSLNFFRVCVCASPVLCSFRLRKKERRGERKVKSKSSSKSKAHFLISFFFFFWIGLTQKTHTNFNFKIELRRWRRKTLGSPPTKRLFPRRRILTATTLTWKILAVRVTTIIVETVIKSREDEDPSWQVVETVETETLARESQSPRKVTITPPTNPRRAQVAATCPRRASRLLPMVLLDFSEVEVIVRNNLRWRSKKHVGYPRHGSSWSSFCLWRQHRRHFARTSSRGTSIGMTSSWR